MKGALSVVQRCEQRVECPTTNLNDALSVLLQMCTTRKVSYNKCERRVKCPPTNVNGALSVLHQM